ncbi:MAG TPA: hypothetical protein VH371_09730 [Candidatus Limnocylindrales bacterium]|jgi:hypothetical protein
MSFSGSSFNSYSRFVFFLLGGIFLVVGLGLFFFLGNVPYAGGAMQLTGGIFIVVAIIVIVAGLIAGRNAQKTQQILQTGIAGTATITGLTQTGVYLNENPQIAMNLLVQLPGEVPYAANVKQVVPLMLLGRLSSGAPLSVRVDQMDRSKIEIDWSSTGFAATPQAASAMAAAQQMMAAGAGAPAMAGTPAMTGNTPGSSTDESLAQVQAALAASGGGMQVANPFSNPGQQNFTVEQLRAYLRQNGLEAQAHVDKLEDTGQTVGDERLFKVESTLMIPGQAPQKLPASSAMVPVAVAHKLFQGMTVPVKYAAENHDLLMVEWDKI